MSSPDVFVIVWAFIGPVAGFIVGKGLVYGKPPLPPILPPVVDGLLCPVCGRRAIGDAASRELHTMVCDGNRGTL